MSIELKVIQQSPMPARGKGSVRGYLSTASNIRTDMTFISPLNQELVIPAGSDIPLVLTQMAERDLGYKGDSGGKDFLAQFERQHLLKLKAENKLSTKIRDSGMPSNEWDSWVISFKTPDALTTNAIKKLIIQEFRSAKAIERIDIDGSPAKGQLGTNGSRAMFISEEHSTDGTHVHFHVITHMHAIDPVAREVSVKMDFSKSGLVETFRQRINTALKQGGIDANIHFDGTSRDASNNAITDKARREIEDLSGDLELDTDDTTETPSKVAIREVNTAPRDMALSKAFEQLEKEVLRETTERLRIEQSLAQKHGQLQSMKLAMEAIAAEAALKSELSTKTIALENIEKELTATKEQAEQTISEKQLQINNIGDTLSSFAPELAEQMKAGDTTAISETLKTVTGRLSAWDEALDQLPEALAETLRADPFEELQNIVADLEAQKSTVNDLTLKLEEVTSNNTKLTNDNESLTVTTNTLTKQNTELETRIAKHEAEMTAIVEKLQKAEAERKQFESELYKAQAKAEVKDAEIVDLKAKNTAIESERKGFETELYKAQAQAQGKDTTIAELQTKAKATAEKIASLESELVETSKQATEINALRAKNAELQTAIDVKPKEVTVGLNATQRKVLEFMEANPSTKTAVVELVNKAIETQQELTGLVPAASTTFNKHGGTGGTGNSGGGNFDPR